MTTQKQPKKITLVELQVLLAQVRTSTFATITTVTEPKMNKKGNPFYGRTKKRATSNVTLNFNYANSVNNQRNKEADLDKEPEIFVPHARKWGERIDGTCLVQHKGEVYAEMKFNGKPSNIEYFVDGQLTEKKELALWLTEPKSNAEHQGVEKEIILRDVKLSNIAEIKLKGEQYEII